MRGRNERRAQPAEAEHDSSAYQALEAPFGCVASVDCDSGRSPFESKRGGTTECSDASDTRSGNRPRP